MMIAAEETDHRITFSLRLSLLINNNTKYKIKKVILLRPCICDVLNCVLPRIMGAGRK
jgi:hypothetical protein